MDTHQIMINTTLEQRKNGKCFVCIGCVLKLLKSVFCVLRYKLFRNISEKRVTPRHNNANGQRLLCLE